MKYIVSIIVPVYNVAPYILQCLQSVVSQTYTGKLECVCVDDCGSDNSMLIVEDFIQHYVGDVAFKIVRHEKNKGLSAARNTGARNSEGDYLYFLDSDDWLEPDCLENLMGVLYRYPDCQLIQAFAKKGEKNFMTDAFVGNMPDYCDNPSFIKRLLLNTHISIIEAWNKLVRRDFILEHNLYFREGIVNEDVLWKFYLAKYVTRMGVCHHNTYNYRIREDSIMTKPVETRFESLLKLFSEMTDNIDDFCREVQVYSIGKQLYDLYYCLQDPKMKKDIALLMKRLSGHCNGWLSCKLFLFYLLHDSQMRRVRAGEFLFYQLTVLR